MFAAAIGENRAVAMANAQPNSEAPFADVPSAVEEFRADLEGPRDTWSATRAKCAKVMVGAHEHRREGSR